jgi:hypothetical protein
VLTIIKEPWATPNRNTPKVAILSKHFLNIQQENDSENPTKTHHKSKQSSNKNLKNKLNKV